MSDSDHRRELDRVHRATAQLEPEKQQEVETSGDEPSNRQPRLSRRWILAASAVVAASAGVGYLLTGDGGGGGGGGGVSGGATMEVKQSTDLTQIQAAIKGMNYAPSREVELIRAAENGDLIMLNFRILASSAEQRYTVTTDRDQHPYTLAKADQYFSLLASARSSSFWFYAIASNPPGVMKGVWHTRRGSRPYSLSAGEHIEVQF
jgi:hypothetical protein